MKNKINFILVLLLFMQMMCGCNNNSDNNISNKDKNKQYEEACNTPFGRYPDTITYTLGKMTGVNNSNMPLGDNYENNAYTRYIKKKLNVQNKDKFEGADQDYRNMVSMAISENDIPDIMVIDDYEQLKMLVERDMLEDLSEVYKKCASDRIKDIYMGYGNEIFDNVSFNGKLMAIPETNIENGPNMLWLRKDWMDKLGLGEPKTIGDAEYIISQFIEKDPGNNGKGKTVGLVCSSEITSNNGFSYMTQTDVEFANYNSYPKQWIKDENGNAVYGSVMPESKQALKHMNDLYNRGILDNKFLLRGQNNIEELIINGECGSFFGLWWAPNNPLINAMKVNRNAEWKPYIISTDKDGYTSFISQNPTSKYVVVRKGYEHPEIAVKINNVLFDYLKPTDESLDEIRDYYEKDVDPTARPLVINIDYENALEKSYNDLNAVFAGEKTSKGLQLLENTYYKQCERYKKDTKNASLEDWAAYTSRITASSVLHNASLKKVKSVFHGQTETMNKHWWRLQKLETEAYLKIITGEEPLSYFDEFVDEWYKQGGKEITNEVNEKIHK